MGSDGKMGGFEGPLGENADSVKMDEKRIVNLEIFIEFRGCGILIRVHI